MALSKNKKFDSKKEGKREREREEKNYSGISNSFLLLLLL